MRPALTTRPSSTPIRRDYPRAADLPGPGFAAGPCLLKDTMQLAAFTADHFPMGQSAMQINEGLPAYVVGAMKRRYGDLRGRTVGILGMAFKAESDDPRASLSYKLRKLLAWEGATVLCTDPYVHDPHSCRSSRCWRRPRSWWSARRTAPTATWTWAAGRWSTSGACSGEIWPAAPPASGDHDVQVLVTGAAGFIAGYLVPELLEAGHEVVGLDDFSKYGATVKSYDDHPRYQFVRGDAKDAGLLRELAADVDQVVAAAAMIGGISYFHRVRLRPARGERAHPGLHVRRGADGPAGRTPRADRRHLELDGVRVRDRLPDAGGRPVHQPAAAIHVRLPEALERVLREGRL